MRWLNLFLVLSLIGCSGVQSFTLKDLRAAQARAERANDVPWSKCMKALGDHVEQQLATDIAPPVGVADAIVAAHLLYVKTQQGIPSHLKADCAEVALELIIVGARLGIRVSGVPIP